MDLQDLLTAFDVRFVNDNMSVKASRAQQRRVQDIRPVSRGNDDNAFIDAESIHLYKQLVQGLFPLVMAAAKTGAPLSANRIDFIYEHDARCIFFGLLKQIAHAGSPYAHEHFHEIRTADGEKRHARLAGHRSGQQRLAGSGRSKEQDALGNPGSQIVELLRVFQKFDDFLQFFLRFFGSGHFSESHLDFFLIVQLGAAFAERHHLAAPALGLLHDKEPHPDEQQHGQQRGEQRRPPRWLRRLFRFDVNLLLAQGIDQRRIVGRNQRKFLTIFQFAADCIVDYRYPIDLLILHLLQKSSIGHFCLGRRLGGIIVDNRYGNNDDQ